MILRKTENQIETMREGGLILRDILFELKSRVTPGVTTRQINEWARELISKRNVKPSFLDYRGYPGVICTSVDDEIVHAVPSGRMLKDGDLLKLDFGVVHKGYHTDSALTVIVGDGSGKKDWKLREKLVRVTREALEEGIKEAKVGKHIGDIGHAVQSHVEKNGFNVSRDLVGHGIGRDLHEDPFVPNYGEQKSGIKLEAGMVIAIEPIVMAGKWPVKDSSDGFGFLTQDGSLSAHFEHTIAITSSGPLILT